MIKVRDVAYGRLRAPDLDRMEAFLLDFGMIRSARTETALYMRGTGPAHHLHVTELGEPAFIGFAFYAQSEADLEKLAASGAATPVEPIDEPGGGKRVTLTDPHGFKIEVVHGIETVPEIRPERPPINWRDEPLNRAGDLFRLPVGPSLVMRMGHAVINSPDLDKAVKWYRETLGLIASDDVYAGAEDNVIGSFSRVDRGDEYVDHHVFFCMRTPHPGLNHFSYEVEDIDDVFLGHEHLKSRGTYEHFWGIGRHLLGSQVFDYWKDPWGNVHEHWTDSDRLNARSGSNMVPAEIGLTSQWGPRPPFGGD